MLFKNSNKLAEYAELNSNTNFFSIKATMRMVEEQHIIPVLGKQQYDALNNAYTAAADEGILTDANKNLLHQCRMVIGPYLCYYFSSKAEVKLSDGGVRREETDNSKTAFQYQTTEYRRQNLKEAEFATEILLQFLDDNKTSYTLWRDSPAFIQYRKLFIKSGKEFNEYFPSHSPYRNYWAMRSKMMSVEENNIRKMLGETLYTDIKTTDLSPSLSFTDKEKILLTKLKMAIAHLTVAFSIPFLNVRLDANGISVKSNNAGSDDALSARGTAGDNALSALIKNCQTEGQNWITNAINYLNDTGNAGEFAGWPIVLVVVQTMLHPTVTSPNEERRGTFGMT